MKIEKINAYLIFLLLVQIIFDKLILGGIQSPILRYYNEIIFLFILGLLILTIIRSGHLKKILILGLIILIYQFFQIKLRNIPASHLMQSFIYVECIIFYTYFYFQTDNIKKQTLKRLTRLFKYFLYVVIIFALAELFVPRIIRDLLGTKDFERGIGGLYFTSVFGTTTGLSQYCLLVLFLYFIYFASFRKFPFPKRIFYIVFGLGLLSFSRKEFVLILVLIIFSFSIIKFGKLNYKKLILPAILGFILVAVSFSLFLKDANKIALQDTYIRYQMADVSFQIIKDYFPFGTGPGTFGSQMSVGYPDIYEKYSVGANITGYDGKRGPIYDAFLFTFTSEMGIGILFYVFFMYIIWRKAPLEDSKLISFIKTFIILSLTFIGLFSPVIMNPFGLICFSILGLITKNENSDIPSIVEQANNK